jgi:FAD/FMN-containing dehydrogenase
MIQSKLTALSGWGRYPVADCRLARAATASAAVEAVAAEPSLIARGNGRSYGDSSLNPQLTLATGRMDRLLSFDAATGLLECEAGLLLAELIELMLPRGWLSPVTPGTKFVTIGGLIAADVHGKNHHVHGSFCDHVEWLDLAIGEGRIERCSRDHNPDLFAATCGGMGLTGVILRAAVRLMKVETARMRQRTIHAPNLDEAIDLFERSLDWTYSVAWIDCLATGASLGRSVVILAEHARAEELPASDRSDPFRRAKRRGKKVPIDFPAIALNPLSVRLFNAVYYRAQRAGDALVDIDPYYYPLDAIESWNRIYGRRGFVQYQCVLPLETSRAGLRRMLEEISSAGTGSFLAVLKRMGAQSFGHLSFPMPGYTLALDFPADAANFALLDRLDAIMVEHGGRLYFAKDSRASAAAGAAGYPRLDQFREVRRRWGIDAQFNSLQSRRLEI